MAHPTRADYVTDLVDALDRDRSFELVWDERNDRWDTGRRALLAYDPSATHHIVIQDDAVVPRDLLAGLERMIAFSDPLAPICLYTGRVRPNKALVQARVDQAFREGCSWIRMPGPWWGVGIVTPTAAIEEMVDWCNTQQDIENYDLRQEAYWRERNTMCLYTVPSMVDHRSGPSLVPNRTGKGRRAHKALTAEDSALDVVWNTRCLNASMPAPTDRGEVRVVSPEGRPSIVTMKAYREVLAHQGWVLADGKVENKEVTHA